MVGDAVGIDVVGDEVGAITLLMELAQMGSLRGYLDAHAEDMRVLYQCALKYFALHDAASPLVVSALSAQPDSADVLSDALLTDVAASTASLVGVVANQVGDITTAISQGEAEGALEAGSPAWDGAQWAEEVTETEAVAEPVEVDDGTEMETDDAVLAELYEEAAQHDAQHEKSCAA